MTRHERLRHSDNLERIRNKFHKICDRYSGYKTEDSNRSNEARTVYNIRPSENIINFYCNYDLKEIVSL